MIVSNDVAVMFGCCDYIVFLCVMLSAPGCEVRMPLVILPQVPNEFDILDDCDASRPALPIAAYIDVTTRCSFKATASARTG